MSFQTPFHEQGRNGNERRRRQRIKMPQRKWRPGMRTHDTPGVGGYTKSYLAHIWRLEDEARHVVTRCEWCPDWIYEGTLAEGRRRAARHRNDEHGVAGMHKDLRILIEEIRRSGKGFKVVASGKHWKVLDGSGRPIVDENGPLILSGSPSESRNLIMARARLRKAGVLSADSDKREQRRQQEADRQAEIKSARRTSEVDASRRRQEATLAVRARFEPLVVKFGGWEKKGRQADVGRALFLHAQSINSDIPKSFESAQMMVHSLRKGLTLSEPASKLWISFIDHLEEYENPESRLWQMVREHKGLPTDPVMLPPARKKAPPTEAPSEPVAEAPPPKRKGRGPTSPERLRECEAVRARLLALEMDWDSDGDFVNHVLANGNALTPIGEWTPGSTAKKPEHSARQHVRELLRGRIRSLNKPAYAWWLRNLADLESAAGAAPPDAVPAAVPDADATAPVEPPTAPVEPTPPEPGPEPAPGPAAPETAVQRPFEITDEAVKQAIGWAKFVDEFPNVVRAIVREELTVSKTDWKRAIDERPPTLALRAYVGLVRSGTVEADALDVAKDILKLEINDILSEA